MPIDSGGWREVRNGAPDPGAEYAGGIHAIDLSKLEPMVAGAKDKKQALEDVFWAVMNSREFMFNH